MRWIWSMVRRSRLEIFFDVLAVIDRGVSKPTRIMYKTNLSWTSLQEVFETLITGDFILEEEYKNSKRYSITDKGRSALAYHLRSLEGLVQVHQLYAR
jgi:predicted transcriptional regulator